MNNDFEKIISKEFKENLFFHLGDMDKHDLITYKMYVNRANIIDGDKIKPNEHMATWTAGMEIYADDGYFPQKDEVVMLSSSCGDAGSGVVPWDYAIFGVGSKIDDSYRGMVLTLNDVSQQVIKLKKLASEKNVTTKELIDVINSINMNKLHQPMFGGDDSMKMLPITKRDK